MVASVSSLAMAQSPSDGWGPYHFGMTVEQVQAMPGTSWDQLHVTHGEWDEPDTYSLTSLAPVTMNGRAAAFTVFFDETKQLNEFEFTRQLPSNGCEAAFLGDLRQLERDYGDFLPAAVNSDTKKVLTLAGGQSKYVTYTSESAQDFLAERDQSGRFVNLSAHLDNAGCKIEIWIKHSQ